MKQFNKLIFICCCFLMVACNEQSASYGKKGGLSSAKSNKPKIEKYLNEGNAIFYGKYDTSEITFELANTREEIERGLMYRKNMPDSVGMLFLFPNEQPRSFWMKNTYISLDIIYVSSDFEVVSIQESAQPFSQYSLPSEGPAKYVIEVNGGYCIKRGIEKGSKVDISYVE